MAPTMPAGLHISILTMALQQRRTPPALLHWDRGSNTRAMNTRRYSGNIT
jgi:hypothetical protein